MNIVPPCGTYFFSTKSSTPIRIDGIEHAGDAAQPADRNHDQEEHEIFESILRIEPEKLRAESAAECGHAAAEREGEGEQPVDIDAEQFHHLAVVDRGADLRADPRALEAEPEAERDHDADARSGKCCRCGSGEAKIDLTPQPRWQDQRLVSGPNHDDHRRDHDEDEPDR